MAQKIVFIGAGNMSQAIVHGLIQNGYNPATITMTARTREKFQALQSCNIHLTTDNRSAAEQADILILAVKPQQAFDVLNELKSFVPANCLVISVMAGPKMDIISAGLGNHIHIIRAIPNTPTLIQCGVTGLYGRDKVDLDIAEKIMRSMGYTIIVQNENALNAITGISGSGPAYFMWIIEQWNIWCHQKTVSLAKHWIEIAELLDSEPKRFDKAFSQKQIPEYTLYLLMLDAMMKAAQDFGFNDTLAKQLCLQTGRGTLKLIATSDSDVAGLRAKVTSQKGTTAAAINVLSLLNLPVFFEYIQANAAELSAQVLSRTPICVDFYQSIKKTTKAAAQRAEELGKNGLISL